MTLVVNLYGGPGTGKSTTAAGVFSLLKQHGVNCELVTEYAKDKVWEESFRVFDNQLYVFARQYQRVFRLLGKVGVIVTDSPLLLSLYYGQGKDETFDKLVVERYKSMRNLDVFLTRVKEYSPIGRMQTEDQAKEIDVLLREKLDAWGIKYTKMLGNADSIIGIANMVQATL